MIDWTTEHPLLGTLLMTVVTIITIPMLIPYSFFSMANGYALAHAYNSQLAALALGTIASTTGAWLGAMISFPIGRYFCKERVKKYIKKKPILEALD